MTDSNSSRAVRVLHLVSTGGVTGATQQSLFMPMLTRMPKQRVKMLAISLSPNAVPSAILRQNGVPVYDVAISRKRFSFGAFKQLLRTVRAFRPDVIQAWGHTAQLVSVWVRKRCEDPVKVIWAVTNTTPLARQAGMVDRQKLKYAGKLAKHADKIVYASEAGASAHRRVGFPDGGHAVVPLGVDPTRFKPDFAMGRKVREQLGIAHDAFVIGMMAPFQPEYDFPTLLKAVGELIKTNPKVAVLLAGHGVQKGNAPLMALVGGGTLGTRTQLLGEWSDVAAFFNACDVACSSALTDTSRMSLVIAMLCGVPCVATGMGAQGEVIGQFGVAVEPGSPSALIRGITRVMQLPQDKRVFMAQGARKHALTNFVSIRSLQKYLQLYYDLVGRAVTAAAAVPAPEIDATIPTPSAEDKAAAAAPKPQTNRTVDMYDLADPDSLEARDTPDRSPSAAGAGAQERPSAGAQERPPPADEKPKSSEGDVLHMFESTLAQQAASGTSPMNERARGVAEELEDLLAPELLQKDGEKAATPDRSPSAASAGAQERPPTTPKPQSPAKQSAVAIAPTPEPIKPVAAVAPAVAASEPPPTEELSLADTMTIFTIVEEKIDKAPIPPTPSPDASAALTLAPDVPAAVPAAPLATVESPALPVIDPASTVPGIAVDAILSAPPAADARAQVSPEPAQLDFLSDTLPETKQIAS